MGSLSIYTILCGKNLEFGEKICVVLLDLPESSQHRIFY